MAIDPQTNKRYPRLTMELHVRDAAGNKHLMLLEQLLPGNRLEPGDVRQTSPGEFLLLDEVPDHIVLGSDLKEARFWRAPQGVKAGDRARLGAARRAALPKPHKPAPAASNSNAKDGSK